MGEAAAETGAKPRILVFDSGLGGLTVFRAIRASLPGADYHYLADDARFPYGALSPDELISGVLDVIGSALADFPADCMVIACNTASTLVLPALRARFSMPIVGTVPAIKPAAATTKSGLVSVLATPGTVRRDYTIDLIRDFARGVDVTLVGSKALAGLAERALRGENVPDEAILAEITPCFVEKDRRRTDHIVLACTHYPLLLERLKALQPWPVEWIDPAPAIARRVVQVLAREAPGEGQFQAHSTKPGADAALQAVAERILALPA
ncbi:MAG: glutamate racemase [Methylobacterium sp.]|nr:glutamate racemase [Methylobacterium sp.]MCA3602315.1 glutamate racemase [Methylobacterium sp.]MCA3615967.1 glutamate racemase [Methylobacterium sp.]MCA4910511.1 glutamate racemase [Methylobacterium sp.]